jgi:hypothetical protein
MWDFNTDIETRDKIIFGSYNPAAYGSHGGMTRRFAGMTLETLKLLHENNFLSLEDCQNFAPSIGEIMEFMEKNEGFTAHGYVVSDLRFDYRVSIEGVEKEENICVADIEAFRELFGDADEFECREDYLYCWYD